MLYAIQWVLSLIFIFQMYLAMTIIGLIFTPLAIFDRKFAFIAIHLWCHWVRLSAHAICGLKSEVRGEVPTDEVIVASKHQSFFDIILIVSALPRPKFIMKKSLEKMPIVNFYAERCGCIGVDRGKRGQAIKKMVADVKAGNIRPGQLIIFPQGTRIAPGVKAEFKVGTGVLYKELGQDVVPAATNVGVFWKRQGIYRGRGTAVVEFLPRIEAGRGLKVFMKDLEASVEARSNQLMIDAGFEISADQLRPAEAEETK
ncbi:MULTISPECIES: lysophospholipid acyltransferase family protein [Pacificibacter]|uniref:lysophospholipid acyltransferase family protein n=1 Tax=Pacificibacter TaxID=1042323 RepID=UPI001C0939D3|nr:MULTISPECIES: lysophospholipid acyltransferase family protein [Pacificibacter]MBU2937879.1 1-acyl-sn-glycerol-3-phosphate acyltransferase [Pacificibacter marinus]MDO6617239.1 lysophospholipid acyltransferase family protein [Pacificibacter sp. 1_MG-2023]